MTVVDTVECSRCGEGKPAGELKQGGKCAICRRGEPGGKGRWHIDHDHRCCGRKRACAKCVRGLLCFNCNVALGYMGDDPALLLAAADYLMSFGEDKS